MGAWALAWALALAVVRGSEREDLQSAHRRDSNADRAYFTLLYLKVRGCVKRAYFALLYLKGREKSVLHLVMFEGTWVREKSKLRIAFI